jgi:hypothetical protein
MELLVSIIIFHIVIALPSVVDPDPNSNPGPVGSASFARSGSAPNACPSGSGSVSIST